MPVVLSAKNSELPSRSGRPSRLLAFCLGLALAGCGGARQSGGSLPQVRAPGPSASHYTTDSTERPVRGDGDLQSLQAGIEEAVAAEEATVEGDGRLAELALWTAGHLGEGGALPPREVVTFFAQRLGIVEPTPHLMVLGQPDPSALRGGVADRLTQLLQRQRYDHYGAALIERDGLTLAVVALTQRRLSIEPLPRSLEGTLSMRGELGAGVRRPVFVIERPDGGTERIPVGSGPRFQVQLPVAQPGVYGVELLAEGERGRMVVANFPVFVSTPVADRVTLHPVDGPSLRGDAASDAEAVALEVRRLLTELRRSEGLGPLEHHDGLREIAAAHNTDMIANGFVGHDSPTTGSPSDRVRRGGYRSGLILENIGRGYSAREIHEGLLASPGHRANLLNPDVTHVGIAVSTEDEGGRNAFVVTQLFLRMNRSIDVADAPTQLLALINEGRRARGAEPLELEPNLAQAAQDGAARFFVEPELSRQDTVDDASASLRRFSIAFRRVGGLMAVVGDIEDAARLEPAFDASVRYVGIGIAQGDRPDVPPNSVAVVIMLGWAR